MRIMTVRVDTDVDPKSTHSVRTTAPGCDYMIETPLTATIYRVVIDCGNAPTGQLWKISERMGWGTEYGGGEFTFVILPDSARLHNITDADGAAAIVQQKLRETHA